MKNLEIIMIVYGSSATIVFILLIFFKWLSIGICKSKRKNENDLNSQESLIKNSSSTLSKASSIKTIETDDFLDLSMETCIETCECKHGIRLTISCDDEDDNENDVNDIFDLKATSSQIQLAFNLNPLEDYLDIKVVQTTNLIQSIFKYFNHDEMPDESLYLSKEFNSHKIYFVISFNKNDFYRSQLKDLDNLIEFNQTFKFLVDDSSIKNAKIDIIFYLFDSFNRIESACLKTSLTFRESHLNELWLPLNTLEQSACYMGELLISLCYLPTSERLRVIIIEARNLFFDENEHFGDSYVKVSLCKKNDSTCRSYRTLVQVNNQNPIYNQTTIFNLSTKDFNNSFLKFNVFQIKTNKKIINIGKVFIGPTDKNQVNTHWNNMLRQLGRNV
ncbi:unnamed protein product [Brachionus calyciflorus]|uniref:C2 domain-containing protein n=1 Tax=Brachionus calyciflorus TaxID=104777 RepID=A0A814BKZ2_9BILA|nr:unnamed protein product [Brachionus calyciflorus]